MGVHQLDWIFLRLRTAWGQVDTAMKQFLFGLLNFCAIALAAGGQTCTKISWCPINTGNVPKFQSNGWNGIFFSVDTERFYLYANSVSGINPEANGFWSYQPICPSNVPDSAYCEDWGRSMPVPLKATNPWTKVSSCGDSPPTQTNGVLYHLAETITPTTGTCMEGCTPNDKIHLVSNAGRITRTDAVTYPGGGTIVIANEAVGYDVCTTDPSGPAGARCAPGVGNGHVYLWGYNDGAQRALRRHMRSMAGYSAVALEHTGGPIQTGEPVYWACSNPSLRDWNDAGDPLSTIGMKRDRSTVPPVSIWDHPPDRHSGRNEFYDSRRGRIWVQFGWEEAWSPQDTWSLCVFNKSGTGETALDACGASDVFDQSATTKGWQRVRWPSPQGLYDRGTAENSSVYDPSTDAIIEFGGLMQGNARDEVRVFCLSPLTTAYGCAQQPAGTWVKLTPGGCGAAGHYCGNPGRRDGAHLAYDPVRHRILALGGVTGPTGWYWNSVAQYDAATGDWCLSYLSGHGESNTTHKVSWCPLPKEIGPRPPEDIACGTDPPCSNGTKLRVLKFPSWAYDTKLNRGVFYGGPSNWAGGGVYLYDPAQNSWELKKPGGVGPKYNPDFPSQQSWAYDSVRDVFVYTQGGASLVYPPSLWQLPGKALEVAPTQSLDLSTQNKSSTSKR